MKHRVKIIVSILLILAVVFALIATYGYVRKVRILEKGILITSMDEQDKKYLCSFFDITYEDSLSFVSLDYRVGWKNSNIELRIQTQKDEVSDLLSKYVVSEDRYSLLGFNFEIDERYELSEQYVHSENKHIRLFLFTNKNDVVLFFLTDRGDDSIRSFIDKIYKEEEYEKG